MSISRIWNKDNPIFSHAALPQRTHEEFHVALLGTWDGTQPTIIQHLPGLILDSLVFYRDNIRSPNLLLISTKCGSKNARLGHHSQPSLLWPQEERSVTAKTCWVQTGWLHHWSISLTRICSRTRPWYHIFLTLRVMKSVIFGSDLRVMPMMMRDRERLYTLLWYKQNTLSLSIYICKCN